MPQAYATEKLVKFSGRLLKQIYVRSIFDKIVNRDYEGEVKGESSIVKIPSLAKLGWKDYAGSVSYDSVQEIVATLTTDQKKYNAFKLKKIEQFESFIKDPKGPLMNQLVDEFKKMVDTFVLAFYDDVAAGQRVGTNYTTGTVAIAVTTGVVTGTGTTFTSAMVGLPFKATGHSDYYRVKTYTSATSIVIEDDKDDVTSAYTGGAITAGATYVIQAATAVAITKTNILAKILELKGILDKAGVPDDNRWLAIPSEGEIVLLQGDGIKISVPDVYQELVKAGFLTELAGFKIYRANQTAGDNTNGYHCLAGSPMWLTFADGLAEGPEELRLESDFASGFRELRVYGAKVADERRKFAAELFATFS